MSQIDDAVDAAFASLQTVYATTVAIRRGMSYTGGVSAIPGGLSDQAAIVRGVTEELSQRDYLIRAADYKIDGAATEPSRGDVIEEIIGGTTRYFRVLPPSNSQQHFGFVGPARTILRVHTKEVSSP